MLYPTLVDQQTRERRPVSIFGGRKRWEVLHNTASDHEQSIHGNSRWAGWLPAEAAWGGGADTALNTSAARLACMPLHSCPRPHRVHTGCTLTTITPAPLTPAPQGHGHTKKEEALPEPYVAWRRASKSKAHPSVLQTLRSWKNRGEALGRGPGQSHTVPTPQTVPPRCVLVTKEGQTGGLSL